MARFLEHVYCNYVDCLVSLLWIAWEIRRRTVALTLNRYKGKKKLLDVACLQNQTEKMMKVMFARHPFQISNLIESGLAFFVILCYSINMNR